MTSLAVLIPCICPVSLPESISCHNIDRPVLNLSKKKKQSLFIILLLYRLFLLLFMFFFFFENVFIYSVVVIIYYSVEFKFCIMATFWYNLCFFFLFYILRSLVLLSILFVFHSAVPNAIRCHFLFQ